MFHQEILEKAIEKAKADGYNPIFSLRYALKSYMPAYKYYAIIFSHEFAKAFWGEEKHTNKYTSSIVGWNCKHCDSQILRNERRHDYCWQYHLQQMALWENPLHYLATFLKSDCCEAKIIYTENSGVYIQPGHFCSKCKKLL